VAIELKKVSTILHEKGLKYPLFKAIEGGNVANYKVLLMQPQAEVEISAAGIRSKNNALAKQQFGDFIRLAVERKSALAITPEYSMPWDVLIGAIIDGAAPGDGMLWAFGCESIKYSDLTTKFGGLPGNVVGVCEMLQHNDDRFVDPLVYCFVTTEVANPATKRIVLLVQFKTTAMGNIQYELDNLQLGTAIYQFGEPAQEIRLVTLICSDAFAVSEADALSLHDRTLLIHIQMNANPRQDIYRKYREKFLAYYGKETEIICLNWAQDICEWENTQSKNWKNVSLSGWYLRPEKYDDSDAVQGHNHKHGLYYTWLHASRVHALYFNFSPSVFEVDASKVAHIGVLAPLPPPRGPRVKVYYEWNAQSGKWEPANGANDGFVSAVDNSGAAKVHLKNLADSNPLIAERALALSSGKISGGRNWHRLTLLDSCSIAADEVIKRITFCQDSDPAATAFRSARLVRLANLWDILSDAEKRPAALKVLGDEFALTWSPDMPHVNIATPDKKHFTAIYLGEDVTYEQAEDIVRLIADYIGRDSVEPAKALEQQERVAVWIRKGGQPVVVGPEIFSPIDKATPRSQFDIAGDRK
jgi:hypothetical protein